MAWRVGEAIVRREVWRGKPWLGTIVFVVEDAPDLLVSYLPEGSSFGFPEGDWPGDGRHPWHDHGAWEGHGVLMLQRPGDSYAVWHFWHGPERAFMGWYLNLQEPFRRTPVGYDTQDQELDIWVPVDGGWRFKDADVMEERIADGRFTREQVAEILAEGDRIGATLDAGERWWDEAWSRWKPPAGWIAPPLPEGWDVV